jgi:hypothetical protein
MIDFEWMESTLPLYKRIDSLQPFLAFNSVS